MIVLRGGKTSLREISEVKLRRAKEVVEASRGKKLFLVDRVPEEIYAREIVKLSQRKRKPALAEECFPKAVLRWSLNTPDAQRAV